jgi:outer membrane lipoprotein-sorting protein
MTPFSTRFRSLRALRTLLPAALIASAILVVPSAKAAPAADDVDKVLARLDGSAKSFKSAQADIIWDHVQTQPIEDKDSQVGTILFERTKSGELQLALHVKTDNGKPALKDFVYSGGIGKMYQPSIKQMQVFKLGDNRAELDTYLTLGFGGSGEDLKKTWKITSLGDDKANGVTAVKLQLVPIDSNIAKTTPKVILWIDMEKGVAVRQQRFGTDGSYVVFSYSNIQTNAKVPSGAFEIKVASGTQIVNH